MLNTLMLQPLLEYSAREFSEEFKDAKVNTQIDTAAYTPPERIPGYQPTENKYISGWPFGLRNNIL
jgi:hypothetical protein